MSAPPPVPAQGEKTKKTRSIFLRVLLWIGSLIGILILLVVLFVAILALWPDKPEFDDSDIMPVWTEGLDDNPLARFQDWAEANSELFPEKGDARLNMHKKDAEWDGEAAVALLEEHKEVLEQFGILADLAGQQWQVKGGMNAIRIDAPLQGMDQLVRIRSLATVQCFREIEQNQYDEAIETAHRLSVIGNKVSRSKGATIHFLIGKVVSDAGTQCLEHLANSNGNWYSPDRYETVVATLSQNEPRSGDLAFSLKADYLGFKQIVSDLKAGKLELGSELGIGNYEQYAQLGSVFLQRNETLALYHEHVMPLINEMERGRFPESATIEKFETKYRSIRLNLMKLLIHPNSAGKLLVSITMSGSKSLIQHTLKSTAKPRVTEVLLALRAYESEKGQLPDSLNKLVPKYLPSIPLDPFSDKALIWNPKERVVYSVGRDRVDNGGMVHLKSSKNGSDIGVKLEKSESTKGK